MTPSLSLHLHTVRWACALACAAALVGCAVPEWQKPGTPASQIQKDMGSPQVRSPLPEGGERWVYSRQPMGQQVYHFDFDSAKHLLSVRQVLEASEFNRLRPGVDTRDSVYQVFGKPAMVEHVASFKGDIWTYRIYENGSDRQAHVFLDPQYVVQRVMFTDERHRDDDRH
ncbi:hypothetical protein [Comamonas sp. GB3 AK4-5]|uniref:hypothetical protein n=1 Tax=Comamonas sp. GB3 AK4-5 TaxID=3231487 RepID=UPI00351EE8C8